MAIKNSYNNLNRFSVVGKRFVVGFSETIRQYFIDYRYRHCYIIIIYYILLGTTTATPMVVLI